MTFNYIKLFALTTILFGTTAYIKAQDIESVIKSKPLKVSGYLTQEFRYYQTLIHSEPMSHLVGT